MKRVVALQALMSTATVPAIEAPPGNSAVTVDQVRASMLVGESSIGLLRNVGAIAVYDRKGWRRYNVPRPSGSQMSWLRQEPPTQPAVGVAVRGPDVAGGPQADELGGITQLGGHLLLALVAVGYYAYLVRFDPQQDAFFTRALPIGGFVRGITLHPRDRSASLVKRARI